MLRSEPVLQSGLFTRRTGLTDHIRPTHPTHLGQFRLSSSQTNGGTRSFDLVLSRTMYSAEAVKRAAYVFMDRAVIQITVSENNYTCSMSPTSDDSDHHQLYNEFLREVLDQDLRISIASETEPIRNLILALAFSQAGLK